MGQNIAKISLSIMTLTSLYIIYIYKTVFYVLCLIIMYILSYLILMLRTLLMNGTKELKLQAISHYLCIILSQLLLIPHIGISWWNVKNIFFSNVIHLLNM